MPKTEQRNCDDLVYDYPDADTIVTVRMTRRQWHHIDDPLAADPDRYPNRAAERAAAWKAIDTPESISDEQNDSLFGTRPGCGCVTAWISLRHSTAAEIRDFYTAMADSGRDVQHGQLTERMRARLGRCPHHDLDRTVPDALKGGASDA